MLSLAWRVRVRPVAAQGRGIAVCCLAGVVGRDLCSFLLGVEKGGGGQSLRHHHRSRRNPVVVQRLSWLRPSIDPWFILVSCMHASAYAPFAIPSHPAYIPAHLHAPLPQAPPLGSSVLVATTTHTLSLSVVAFQVHCFVLMVSKRQGCGAVQAAVSGCVEAANADACQVLTPVPQ